MSTPNLWTVGLSVAFLLVGKATVTFFSIMTIMTLLAMGNVSKHDTLATTYPFSRFW
jgi:hypothetical protein